MTFGYSRDDVGKFLPAYIEKGILAHDPFQVRAAGLVGLVGWWGWWGWWRMRRLGGARGSAAQCHLSQERGRQGG
jgi:hypothetical protein